MRRFMRWRSVIASGAVVTPRCAGDARGGLIHAVCPDGLGGPWHGCPHRDGPRRRLPRRVFAARYFRKGLGVVVTVSTFDRDDAGYLRWLATHPSGYVINILRSLNAGTARLHHASCRTIGGQPPAGRTWTGPYLKVCSDAAGVLDEWALEHVGASITRCGTCRPSGSGLRGAAKVTSSAATTLPPKPARRAVRGQATEIGGPWPDRPVVEAWVQEYIRFERRPVEQEQLRAEIRRRLGQLTAAADQVLHATFFGAKHPAADVENLALYYIDDTGASFANAARYAISHRGTGLTWAPSPAPRNSNRCGSVFDATMPTSPARREPRARRSPSGWRSGHRTASSHGSVTWLRESSTASSARSRLTPTDRVSVRSRRGSRSASGRHPMRSRRSWCGKTGRCSASFRACYTSVAQE